MNSLGWKTNLLQLFRPLPAGGFDFVKSDLLIGSRPLVPGDEFQHRVLKECLIDPVIFD